MTKKKQILRTLYKARRPLSTNKVADKSDMSWNTAETHLKDLVREGKVAMARKGEKGTKKVWYLKSNDS